MSCMVSIIIPAFNVEPYIEECLQSARNQTYPDIQIIVVDDGSTDKTSDIVSSIADKDNRIIVIKQDNCGVSSARNTGLMYANGDFISFLDADDKLEPNAIDVSVNAMERSSSDLVSFSFQYSFIDDMGHTLNECDFIDGTYTFNDDEDRFIFIAKELMQYHVGVEVCNKLLRRKLIEECSLRFSEECCIGEDFAFTIKYLMHSNRIACLQDRLYVCRNRKGSAMNTKRSFERSLSDRALMLEDVWEHINRTGNQYFYHKFPVLFIMGMNKIYIGHCASEVAEKICKISEKKFIRMIYCSIPEVKNVFLDIYRSEIARIMFRYHLYLKCVLDRGTLQERIELALYNFYRKLRGREVLESWIMPY